MYFFTYRFAMEPTTHKRKEIPDGDSCNEEVDIVIVGGGVSGLSAATVLGRCHRRVLILDEGNSSTKYFLKKKGQPRNIYAKVSHTFLTRDGIPPPELYKVAMEQLKTYKNVEYRKGKVERVIPKEEYNEIEYKENSEEKSKTVCCKYTLLATGVMDSVPEVEGVKEMFGTSVHHCPICDGFEDTGKRIAIYGKDGAPTNDEEKIPEQHLRKLQELKIPIREDKIKRLVGKDKYLQKIEFETGKDLECDTLYFNTGRNQTSNLPELLGCTFNDKGNVEVQAMGKIHYSRILVSGNCTDAPLNLLMNAASEGLQSAFKIHSLLINEEMGIDI